MTDEYRLEHTRNFLPRYLMIKEDLLAELDLVNSNDDYYAWEKRFNENENALRHQFWLDTAHINTRDNCMRVHPNWLIEQCELIEKELS